MSGARQLTLFGRFSRPPPPAGEQRRHAHLAGRLVEYRITRSRRRSIAIIVDADGLAVRAPGAARCRDIEGFLASKARWIINRLDASRDAPRPARITGVSGETVSVSGEQLRVDVRGGAGVALRGPGALVLEVRDPLDRAAVRAALVAWLKRTEIGRAHV